METQFGVLWENNMVVILIRGVDQFHIDTLQESKLATNVNALTYVSNKYYMYKLQICHSKREWGRMNQHQF